MKTQELDFTKILEEALAKESMKYPSEPGFLNDEKAKELERERVQAAESRRRAAENFIEEFGQGQTITIRKLGFGKIHSITDQATNIKVVGRKQTADPEYGLAKILTVMAGVVEAPFPVPITREFIDDELDPGLGELLFQEIDELSSMSPKKKNGLKPSGEEESTTETSS